MTVTVFLPPAHSIPFLISRHQSLLRLHGYRRFAGSRVHPRFILVFRLYYLRGLEYSPVPKDLVYFAALPTS